MARGVNDPIRLPAASFLHPDLEARTTAAIAGDDAGREARMLAAIEAAIIPPGTIDDVLPPPGFLFLTDDDGAILTDDDGAYLVEAV